MISESLSQCVCVAECGRHTSCTRQLVTNRGSETRAPSILARDVSTIDLGSRREHPQCMHACDCTRRHSERASRPTTRSGDTRRLETHGDEMGVGWPMTHGVFSAAAEHRSGDRRTAITLEALAVRVSTTSTVAAAAAAVAAAAAAAIAAIAATATTRR